MSNKPHHCLLHASEGTMREGGFTLVVMTKLACLNSHVSKHSQLNTKCMFQYNAILFSHHSEVKDPELLELISRLTSLLLQIEVSGIVMFFFFNLAKNN